MATAASATLSPVAFKTTTTKAKKPLKVRYLTGFNSYGNGLRADDSITSLGVPVSTEKAFAKVVSSISKGRKGGGVLTSTCNAAEEIFRIAAIMNGLVLVGVAVGFVLLRIEASLEEAE